jgi:hypothetical protein
MATTTDVGSRVEPVSEAALDRSWMFYTAAMLVLAWIAVLVVSESPESQLTLPVARP